MNQTRILYLFTRTPLHIGAGASVGAIDQPIVRERHTGFPVIPASSLKGSFADQWPLTLRNREGFVRLKTKKEGNGYVVEEVDSSGAAWLFGSDDANVSFAGALQFTEARLLAFPIRSAKGSFAWITCPLILRRAARDGVLSLNALDKLPSPLDDQAAYGGGSKSPLDFGGEIVLEEYTFKRVGDLPSEVSSALAGILSGDPVWGEAAARLVLLSDGMMSYFAQNACEVAQHVRISDETGTAEGGALFNQENVPSETLFYSVVHSFPSRADRYVAAYRGKTAEDAMAAFSEKLSGKAFQFGGDASTGLGYCSVVLSQSKGA